MPTHLERKYKRQKKEVAGFCTNIHPIFKKKSSDLRSWAKQAPCRIWPWKNITCRWCMLITDPWKSHLNHVWSVITKLSYFEMTTFPRIAKTVPRIKIHCPCPEQLRSGSSNIQVRAASLWHKASLQLASRTNNFEDTRPPS